MIFLLSIPTHLIRHKEINLNLKSRPQTKRFPSAFESGLTMLESKAVVITLLILFYRHQTCCASQSSNIDKSHTFGDSIFSYRQSTIDIYNCNGIRNRRDIRDLSAAEVQDWQTAISELISERQSNPNSFWDILVQVHIAFTGEAHRGSYFHPWHRLFLLVLENVIRGRGRPNFALPYWDWSVDAIDAALSEIWNTDLVGGAQRSASGAPLPIPNGPFAGTTAAFPSPHTVLRNFTSGVSGGMRSLIDESIMRLIINATTFSTFAVNAEIAHDIVHVGVGGDMAVVNNAPNDPIFYLHHAFVDFVYNRRQTIFGVNDFGGIHNFPGGAQSVSPNFVFQAFGRPASDGFSTPCVNYIPYSFAASSIRTGKHSERENVDLSILKDACKDKKIRMGMPRKVCLRAVKRLENSL